MTLIHNLESFSPLSLSLSLVLFTFKTRNNDKSHKIYNTVMLRGSLSNSLCKIVKLFST